MTDRVAFTAPLMVWTNPAQNSSMTFVTVPAPAAHAIKAHEVMRRLELGPNGGGRRGFGSVKVTVHLGDHAWGTSVFPQKDGTWFLPIKAEFRRAEGLAEGDAVSVELELL